MTTFGGKVRGVKNICKILLPVFAAAAAVAFSSAPTDAYVSNFSSYLIQGGQGAAAMASGTSGTVKWFAARVTCTNTGTLVHYGPARYVPYDPSSYVCPAGGIPSSRGYVFGY